MVVVVVDVVVDEVLTGAGTALCGMVVVLELVVPPPLDDVGATVVVGTTPTEIDCDAAAAAYTSFPACDADTTHVPTVLNVTTPAEIEQTEVELFDTVTVGASEASLSTCTVYVPPTTGEDGGVDLNVNT